MLAELSCAAQSYVLAARQSTRAVVAFVVAAFVAFYLNYIPIHLATATHLNDLFAAVAHTVFDDHDHGDAEHDTDHHIPHPASDHALTIATQAQTSLPSVIVLVYPGGNLNLHLEPDPLPLLQCSSAFDRRQSPPTCPASRSASRLIPSAFTRARRCGVPTFVACLTDQRAI
jgi:hypothetical protein